MEPRDSVVQWCGGAGDPRIRGGGCHWAPACLVYLFLVSRIILLDCYLIVWLDWMSIKQPPDLMCSEEKLSSVPLQIFKNENLLKDLNIGK